MFSEFPSLPPGHPSIQSMLSLLSLLLASGTVLRADTERWTPLSYPNPRRNHTTCNTWQNSTLCDPDHILTDQWRSQINENIQRQMQKLTEANVPLAEKAPSECANRTEGVTIFVLLAKRIWTINNQTITGNDLTNFGDELAKQYGLNELPCKTFLLLIGIEAAKLAYVRTGKDLRLPADLMQRVFHEYKLFNAKNFMAGLNKIVDEIGEQMADPFKDQASTTASSRLRQGNATSSSTDSTTLAEIVAAMEEKERNGTEDLAGAVDGDAQAGGGRGRGMTAPWWMFLSLGAAILLAFGSLALLAIAQQRQREQVAKGNPAKGLVRSVFSTVSSGRGGGGGKAQGTAQNDEEAKGELRVDLEEATGSQNGRRQGINVPAALVPAKGRGAEGRATEEFSSTTSSTQSSSDFEELENAPRVRIGAAELATDVFEGRAKGQ